MLLRGFRNNVLHVVQQHIEGSDHKKNRRQARMTQYLSSSKRKSLEDFTSPFMAALCLGYRPSTYVCMCIYMFVYVFKYVHAYLSMHMRMYVCICVYLCICMYIYVYVRFYMYLCVCMYVCICIYTFVCVYIHTYI
jgi:hypothetical protein